jgi:hypothetical protein
MLPMFCIPQSSYLHLVSSFSQGSTIRRSDCYELVNPLFVHMFPPLGHCQANTTRVRSIDYGSHCTTEINIISSINQGTHTYLRSPAFEDDITIELFTVKAIIPCSWSIRCPKSRQRPIGYNPTYPEPILLCF